MNNKQTNSDHLNENFTEIIALRDKLLSLTKPKFPNVKCTLKEYGNRIMRLLGDIDAEIGEHQLDRRREIFHSLNELMDIPNHQLNSAFKTNRRKFVALMNDYARAIRPEFIEYK